MRAANHHPAVAAHRFGLGEPDLARVGDTPQDWLARQIGPADAPIGASLPSGAEALQAFAEQKGKADPGAAAQRLREIIDRDRRSRLETAVATERPFAERLVLFWSNHFAVSVAKGQVRGLAGALEREAIRPHIAGRFATLLRQACLHPAMLRYLDNNTSAGPQSPAVRQLLRKGDPNERRQRSTGLNENLAREILELHSLGVSGGGGVHGPWGGYQQRDVTALAALLTGWRAYDPPPRGQAVVFMSAVHQPGPKQVLGREYPEGAAAIDALMADLAAHPSTARHISYKLARHFVADDPPASLVQRLVDTYRRSDGELAALYRTLIESPEAWQPETRKLRTPEEFVLAALRLLTPEQRALAQVPALHIGALGQLPHSPPSPAGWPDDAASWLGPDALWKRIEWSLRLGRRLGDRVDARQLARRSLGPWLGDATREQIERAADAPQALALLLMAPEFQRR